MATSSERSPTKQLLDHLFGELTRELAHQGYQVMAMPSDPEVDLFASQPNQDLLIEIKVVRNAARKSDIEEKLGATAIRLLQKAKQWAKRQGKPTAAVILIGLPELSDKTWELTRIYGRSWLAPLSQDLGTRLIYGLVDSTGTYRLHPDTLPDLAIQPLPGLLESPENPEARIDLFSELNQWQLKILLGIRLPPKWITRPDRHTRVRKAPDLAKLAGVSRALSYKLISALKADHFLHEGTYLNLTRDQELLQRWAPYGGKYGPTVAAAPIFPGHVDNVTLGQLLQRFEAYQRTHEGKVAPNRVAIAGTAAADYLGLGHVSGVVPVVYCDRITDDLLQVMGLRRTKPGEAPQVLFRRPKYPEAVFRATVRVNEVPVTDIVQTWMDVQHTARGEEQATMIWEALHRCLTMNHAFGPDPSERDLWEDLVTSNEHTES